VQALATHESSLVKRLGKRFESARPLVRSLYYLHWHLEIEAEKPRFSTFAEGSELEHDDLGAILPNTFPGWASSAAELFTYIFGLGEGALPLVAMIFLISIALSVTLSPVVYQLLEKVQAVMVVIILAFIALAIFIATDLSAWAGVVTEAPEGIANLPSY
jgi:hypothetical protein